MLKHGHRILSLLTVTLAVAFLSYAQQPTAAPSTKAEALTNADVLKLVEAKLSDDLIISKIRASACSFDTDTDTILKLKSQGVSDAVIQAMVGAGASPTRPLTSAAPPADPNDPKSPHESGLYWLAKQGPERRMVRLESSSYPGQKASPGFMSAKVKAVLSGQHAALRISEPTPEFWFYFDEKSTGLSQSPSGASKPEDFVLAKMDAKSKERELVIADMKSFGRLSSGVREGDTISVDVQKVAPSVYKVTPIKPVGPGEYCFVPSGAAGAFVTAGGRLFDFGIDPAK